MKRYLLVFALVITAGLSKAQNVTLNVRALIEGFYQGNGVMKASIDPVNYPAICDTMTVNLLDTAGNYDTLYSSTSVLSIIGYGDFDFPVTPTGRSYFIQLQHRNALSVMSKYPVYFGNPNMTFDFTVLPMLLCSAALNSGDGYVLLYSGDVTHDGKIDTTDFTLMDIGMTQFIFGYDVLDLNGDLSVESLDYSLMGNNYHFGFTSGYPFSCIPLTLRYNQDTEEQLSVFPNPTKDKIGISYSPEQRFVELHDPAGKLIRRFSVEGVNNEIDLSFLDNGVYFLTMHAGKSELHKKIVKI